MVKQRIAFAELHITAKGAFTRRIVLARMNGQRAAIVCPPRTCFNAFFTKRNQCGPRLCERKSFHALFSRSCDDCAANVLRDLRDDRVAESPQSVHPSGNPMSHSTHVGFNVPPTISFRRKPPSLAGGFEYAGPPDPSEAFGVGNIFTAVGSDGFPLAKHFGALLPSVALGVGHIRTAPASVRYSLPFLR